MDRRSRGQTVLARIPEMGHALAAEPGLDPRPALGDAEPITPTRLTTTEDAHGDDAAEAQGWVGRLWRHPVDAVGSLRRAHIPGR